MSARTTLCYGHATDGRTTIRTVCMVCRHVMVAGLPDSPTSHGLCANRECTRLVEEPFTPEMVLRLSRLTAFAWGRYQRVRGSCERVVGRDEASLFAEYRRSVERLEWAVERMARSHDGPAARSASRGEPYVIHVGSPGGVVAEYTYPTFAELLADIEVVRTMHPPPHRALSFGNSDCADMDDCGLTDDELELLEEWL